MAVNEKSLKNLDKGKKFSSDNQPENNGRKPSALRFIRDEGMSITDIKKIIGSLIWEYNSEELAEILQTVKVKIKDKSGKTKTITKLKDPIPMGVNLVLGALTADLQSKSINNFEKLMDRSYGKPTQNVDLNATGAFASIDITPEERRKQIEELLKKCEIRPKKTGTG